MGLRERLAEHRQPFEAVLAVATCRDSLFFADLCWAPFDTEAELRRGIENRDPGVMFDTASRGFVVEEHSGEMRFYAGGWGKEIDDHPCELGIVRSEEDEMKYAEAFLVHRLHPEQIPVRRGIFSAAYDLGRA